MATAVNGQPQEAKVLDRRAGTLSLPSYIQTTKTLLLPPTLGPSSLTTSSHLHRPSLSSMAASFLTISRPASFVFPPPSSPTATTKLSHRLSGAICLVETRSSKVIFCFLFLTLCAWGFFFFVSGFRPKALRVSAVAKKWDPSKVFAPAFCFFSFCYSFTFFLWIFGNYWLKQVVPQADRVLVRLEEVQQVGCFYFSDAYFMLLCCDEIAFI